MVLEMSFFQADILYPSISSSDGIFLVLVHRLSQEGWTMFYFYIVYFTITSSDICPLHYLLKYFVASKPMATNVTHIYIYNSVCTTLKTQLSQIPRKCTLDNIFLNIICSLQSTLRIIIGIIKSISKALLGISSPKICRIQLMFTLEI